MDTHHPQIRQALENEAMVVHFPETMETYPEARKRMEREQRIKEAQADQRRKMLRQLRIYPRRES